MKRLFKKLFFIIFWIVIWAFIAHIIDQKIILATPLDSFKALINLSKTGSFYLSIVNSFFHITLGFLIACLLAMLLSFLSYTLSFFSDFLSPAMNFIRSVPIAAFVIIALFWMPSKNLSILISAIIVLPVIYASILQSAKQTDLHLLQMATIYQFSPWRKFWYIYRPQILPHFLSSVHTAYGMAWKAGIAAEVISVPKNTIGEGLYLSKVYLASDELLAYTMVIILVSSLFEFLLGYAIKKFAHYDLFKEDLKA